MQYLSSLRKVANRIVRAGNLLIIEKQLYNGCTEKCNITPLEFRWITIDALSEIARLGHLTEEVVKKFFRKKSLCLGAYSNNSLIGYVWCHFKSYQWPFFKYEIDCSDKPHIGPDFVKKEFRGKRLHGVLLSLMFNELFSKGYQSALSSVWTTNTPSLKGLIKVGYHPIKSIYAVRIRKILVYKKVKDIDQWPALKGLEKR